MRKTLYIQLGKKDKPPKATYGSLEDLVVLNMSSKGTLLDHGLDKLLDQLYSISVAPSEIAIDLLLIAASVHIADSSINRQSCSDDSWTRQITLDIPVSDDAVWQSVADHLGKMLRFLTGDYWNFKFRERPSSFQSLSRPPDSLDLLRLHPVSLFSGGLDSLIGAVDLLAAGKKPLFVSHYWDSEASSAQYALQEKLSKKFGQDSFEIIRARIGVGRSTLQTAGSENSQRARSFLFYSMAAIAADSIKTTDTVLIPENGLIALNVPMEPMRLGSLSTRTAHPYFIQCMRELTAGVGMSVGFENPYELSTKGEMIIGCGDRAFLKKIAPLSMSCSAPAKTRWQGVAPQHCGRCVPCLIRRAAMEAGFKNKDTTKYFLSKLDGVTLDSKRSEGKDIRSFLFAADTIKKHPHKIPYYVRKPGPLPPDKVTKYASLYKRGMGEVSRLLKGVKSGHE